jgi:RNA polymerase sigma-70 factor (ECF subfamily)
MIASPQVTQLHKLTPQLTQEWNLHLEKVGASRDRDAFIALFKHFAPLLKGFLLKSGGMEQSSAEELVQEVMLKVWNKAADYQSSQSSASTWIYTIARNTRIDWFRKQSRQNPNLLSADDLYDEQEAPSAFASMVSLRNYKNIHEQLNGLPVEQSEVLKLMYFKGKSGSQVATELGVPLGTVKSRIRLALNKMRINLSTENGELGEMS